ncbi:MAG: hypothetical protein JO182_29700 [Acidobacteriaceae bacterium]|nr:hypothetical protein [Acidobacteriaceae bacterium]
MKFRLQLITIQENGQEQAQELTELARREELRPETIGLTLPESKQILQTLQQAVAEQQVKSYLCERSAGRVGSRSWQARVYCRGQIINLNNLIDLTQIDPTLRDKPLMRGPPQSVWTASLAAQYHSFACSKSLQHCPLHSTGKGTGMARQLL